MVCESTLENNSHPEFYLKLEMAHDITEDYIKHRLRIAGFSYKGGPTDHPTNAMRTMRLVAQQFEGHYINAEQVDMTGGIDMTGQEQVVLQALDSISSDLFATDINWGRIVGLVVLTSNLSLRAMQAHRPQITDRLVTRAASILNGNRFSTWINQHGGWDGFVQHFNRGENGRHEEEFSWSKVATVGIATVAGAAAAINFFMQKS